MNQQRIHYQEPRVAGEKMYPADVIIEDVQVEKAVTKEKALAPIYQPESLMQEMTPEDKQEVQALANRINVSDPLALTQYGVDIQSDLSQFTKKILENVKNKEAGEIGNLLTTMIMKMKDVDINSYDPAKKSLLARIPVVGDLVDQTKRFMQKYKTVSEQLEGFEQELRESRQNLARDINMLDVALEKNDEYIRKLSIYIAAGQVKLKELHEQILPAMQRQLDVDPDNHVLAEEYGKTSDFADLLDKKIHRLIETRAVALLDRPQIRILQKVNALQMEQVQDAILHVLPIWERNITKALVLHRSTKMAEVQDQIRQTTNNMITELSRGIKETSLRVVEQSENGVVQVETLRQAHDDLINTLTEAVRIQEQGRALRARAEQEIQQLEVDLMKNLQQIAAGEKLASLPSSRNMSDLTRI